MGVIEKGVLSDVSVVWWTYVFARDERPEGRTQVRQRRRILRREKEDHHGSE